VQRFGLPKARGLVVLVVPGQELGPDLALGGELSELEPDLVLVELLERQVCAPASFNRRMRSSARPGESASAEHPH